MRGGPDADRRDSQHGGHLSKMINIAKVLRAQYGEGATAMRNIAVMRAL